MAEEKSFRHAVKWAYVMQGSEQGLNVLFTFMFAAILGPKDFGTVAMGMAYILFVKLLLEQGFLPALVQRRDLQQKHLDSVFFLNLGVSLLLTVATIGISKWWARVNHLPILASVITALSVTLVLEALTIVQRAVLERDLDFKSFSIRSIVANLAGGAVGLGMALKGYGVWSLVGKQLATDTLGLIVLWKLSSWRPSLSFSFDAIRDLLGYSLGSFTGNLGVWLNAQIDTLIIGLFFGPVSVGLYRLAGRIPMIIVTGTTSSLQAAAFPQFCRIQHDPPELRKNMLSCFRLAVLLSVPVLAGVAVMSKPLLSILGPKWMDASTAMTIICFAAMAMPIGLFTAPLLQALSKTHFLAGFEWVNAGVAACSVVVTGLLLRGDATRTQVDGIAVARILVAFGLSLPFILWMFHHFAGLRPVSVAKTVMPTVLSAAAMVVAIKAVSAYIIRYSFGLWGTLTIETAVAAVTVTSALLLLDRDLRHVVSVSLGKITNWNILQWQGKTTISAPPESSAGITKD